MKSTPDLLDAVKEKKGIQSDYALAAFIGVTRAHVSKWRCGRESLTDEKALQVAEILGIDSGYILALMSAERAQRTNNAAAAAAWTKLADLVKNHGAAAALLLLVAAPALSPTPANAAQLKTAAGVCILC